MTKKMLIDATHEEETRVAVVDGNRLSDFDYESAFRKQLKGSIFLAKVTRVEPSLQAAFVNFGGNRHGFLPFSEIHPDYFRIPISDREALIAEQEAEMEARRAAEEAEDLAYEDNDSEDEEDSDAEAADLDEDEDESEDGEDEGENAEDDNKGNKKRGRGGRGRGGRGRGGRNKGADSRKVEIVGGDGIEGDQPQRPIMRKNYKIQEVVKRGQIMLIQVSKEERGNKGAAVGTYLSLPGRYCVLMPNSPRAGGVSRKIANFKERKRMREILKELQVPQGMSVIMRTAGVSRTKAEIKRDLDYLMKLWDGIRSTTLESTAPALIHEEGSLVRRAIRDIYTRDIDEIIVSGEEGYKKARDVIKMMIPSHAKKVQQYKDDKFPLFQRYQIESQISEIGDPVVTLPSGGYLVINPTEALVSVDVNSGRATKERHIEETALRTNLEAAEEVARQLRLRDLGGLVVVDFIDMENRRNNRKVENKIRDALSTDRARIQIGRISTFGLMELSRQRMNPSLTEAQFEKCSHCQGVGVVRSVDATAINAIRALEEEGTRNRSDIVTLTVSNAVALYILNNKRKQISEIEERYGFDVNVEVRDDVGAQGFKLEVSKSENTDEPEEKETQPTQSNNNQNQGNNQQQSNNPQKDDEDGQQEKRRNRRGRRGGRNRRGRNRNNENGAEQNDQNDAQQSVDDEQPKPVEADAKSDEKSDEAKKPRRRGGRGKKSEDKAEDTAVEAENKADQAEDKSDAAAEEKKPATKKAAAKKPAKKTAKKADEKVEESSDQAEEKKPAKKAAAKKKAAPKKEDKAEAENAKEVPAPSNDSEPVKKDYEVVNEAPEKKKKGWWSRAKD